MLCPVLTNAQALRPLEPGEAVPPLAVYTLRGEAAATEKLAGPPGGLLILDFWATWCASCLYNFRKLDSLQQAFDGRLEVLLVNAAGTGDDEEKIRAFFKKRKNGAGGSYRLPTVVGDTVLKRLFPHNLLPHYVWIREGRVVAITSSEEVTADNIRSVLGGEAPALRRKNDLLGFERHQPLFTPGADKAPIRYRSLIAGYIEGLSAGTVRHYDTARGWHRVCHTNQSVLGLYQQAYGSWLPRSRVVLEGIDGAAVAPPGPWDNWKYDRSWTYELIVPAAHKDGMPARMQADLEHYFGYTAAVERRPLTVWVLRKGRGPQPRSRGGASEASLGEGPNYLRHQPLHHLVGWLNYRWALPVVDESGYKLPVDLELPDSLEDVEAVRAALCRQGFELVPAERAMEVFVIKEAASRKLPAASREREEGSSPRSER